MEKFGRYLRELSVTEQLIILYLTVPVAVFYLGWLKPLYGVPAVILLAGLFFPRFGRGTATETPPSFPSLATAAILAICWACLGGAGHLFYANGDWAVRDAVLRDLVAYPWPVNYSASVDEIFLLRAPLGYYLPAALAGKLIGLSHADSLLLLWTITGVILLFLTITASCRKYSQLLLTLVVFIFFSGMDVIGTIIIQEPVSPTSYLEWWAAYFQYSSMTTVLFWVPNHGLPGWLAAALFVRHWRNPRFLPLAFLLVTIMPLWSPLTAIGVMLLFIALFLFHLRRGDWRALFLPEIFVATLIALPILHYLTLGAGKVAAGGWVMSRISAGEFFFFYSLFICLELFIVPFVVYAEFRHKTGQAWLTVATFIFLLIFPFVFYTPENDLVMRASIPLLAVIALRSAAVVATGIEKRSYVLCTFILLGLAVGAITPICEITRALSRPGWQPDLATNLVTGTNASSDRYYVNIPAARFPGELKTPELFRESTLRK